MARKKHAKSISQKNDASCINNKRNMSYRAKRNSNKRDRQLLLKDTTDLLLEVDMPKFTQKELEEAYEQIREERKQDLDTAQNAVDWVIKTLDIGVTGFVENDYYSRFHKDYPQPNPLTYVLILSYDFYFTKCINLLDKASWAKKCDGVAGFNIHSKFYEVSTPFGIYKLTFNYNNY